MDNNKRHFLLKSITDQAQIPRRGAPGVGILVCTQTIVCLLFLRKFSVRFFLLRVLCVSTNQDEGRR